MPRTVLALLAAAVLASGEAVYPVANPGPQSYAATAFRLPAPLPPGLAPARGAAPLPIVVSRAGTSLPSAMVEEDGAWWAVVRDDLAAGATAEYRVAPGQPPAAAEPVRVQQRDGLIELDNGRVAVRVPASAPAGQAPGPIAAVRVGAGWLAASRWVGAPACTAFDAAVIADGQATAAVRLRWRFAGTAGASGTVPCFAEVTVRLDPGADHAEIAERHALPMGARWELHLAAGWSPDRGFSAPHWQGAGGQEASKAPSADRPLAPVANPAMRSDLFLALLPRWNQHFKDGWRAAVGDGTRALGAVAVKASRWVWPHDNAVELSIDGAGTLRLPAERGRRVWWLTASPAVDRAYLERWWLQHPERIGGFIADFPGAKGGWQGISPYDGSNINPTGHQRGQGRQALKNAGKPGDRTTLLRLQDWIHPDIYGSYWLGWSPENPNFFSDFHRQPVGWAAMLKAHPRFAELRAEVEERLRQDLWHSVTMPGGAGQECPGYLGHSLGIWREIAEVSREHLGFDPTADPRFRAAEEFRRRISQPDGPGRRDLPIGDTHPDRKGGGGPARVEVDAAAVRGWASEEFPGFGAILRDRPGTPEETYVSFKSGPNRGHYHGDQLAIHWCSAARPLAVDHHASYNPRVGQEHMHNRVSFATPDLPYANMDGYERLIGVAFGGGADIAVGEVASNRLRAVAPLPPENWHQEWPQQELGGELRYRRTIVLMKGGPQAWLVLRDQWWSPQPVRAAFNLHVRAASAALAGPQAVWDGRLTVRFVQPAPVSIEALAWAHENGGREETNGIRAFQQPAAQGEFIAVLWPGADAPASSWSDGVLKVGGAQIRFAADGGVEAAGTVLRASAIDPERSQGEVGLFVPDAGYPFGRIPDWLIRQRGALPAFAPAWAARMRDETP